jgi:hypothetical protein
MKTAEDRRKEERRRRNTDKRLEEKLFNPCIFTI